MPPMRCDRCPDRFRVTSFLLAISGVGVVWLGILPRLATVPAVQAFIERNEELGIDPGVRFYTELPAMPRILDEIETAHRRSGNAFWNWREE